MSEVKATEESPGVASSKRVAGLFLVALGGILLLGLGVYSIFAKSADGPMAFQCGMALSIVGGSLLGVTIFEGFFKK
jgi:hypothetical protein